MSVKVGDLLIGIKSKYDDKGVDQARGDLKGLGFIATTAGTALGFLGAKAVGAGIQLLSFGAKTVVGLVKNMVSLNQKMEEYGVILETTLGSKEKANQALEWVKDFAKTTPYEIDQVTQAYVRLAAYGIDAQDGVLRTLGDTASAMGKDIMWAVEALADAQTGEFERLKEFGVKAIQESGQTFLLYTDKFGKEQKALIDRNNRETITSTLMGIWNEKYEGGMEKLSKTWTGIISNIKDTWNQALQFIGEPILNFLKDKGQKLLDWVENLKKSGKFDELIKNIQNFISEGLDKLETAINNILTAFDTLRTEMNNEEFADVRKSFRELIYTINNLSGSEYTGGFALLTKYIKINLTAINELLIQLNILISAFNFLYRAIQFTNIPALIVILGIIKLITQANRDLVEIIIGERSLTQAFRHFISTAGREFQKFMESLEKPIENIKRAIEGLTGALGMNVAAGVSGSAEEWNWEKTKKEVRESGFGYLQTGGILPKDMFYFGHAGEKVTDAATTRHMMLGRETEPSKVINVNIYNPNVFDQIGITKLARTIQEELLRIELARA